jgi:DNA-binding CsgD family transcriptional regulator
LLDLYGGVRLAKADRFRHAALEVVKQHIHFDSALWGCFDLEAGGARTHSGTLYHLPDHMMVEYQDVREHDWINLQTVMNPGATLSVCVEAVKNTLHPLVLAYMNKYGMHHTLSTAFVEPGLNLWTAISFFRGRAGPAFAETERALKQELVPHLVQAWHLNAIRNVSQRPASADLQRARALIDTPGVVHSTEPGLVHLLRREWPDWQGPAIPAAVVDTLASTPHFIGHALVVRRVSQFDRMSLIEVREASDVDRLTPRQRDVALAFAAGRTYREIAADLGASPTTIRNHLQSVYERLGVSTKIELARRLEALLD